MVHQAIFTLHSHLGFDFLTSLYYFITLPDQFNQLLKEKFKNRVWEMESPHRTAQYIWHQLVVLVGGLGGVAMLEEVCH